MWPLFGLEWQQQFRSLIPFGYRQLGRLSWGFHQLPSSGKAPFRRTSGCLSQ